MGEQHREIILSHDDDVLAAVQREMRRVLAAIQQGRADAWLRDEIGVTFTVVVRQGQTTIRAEADARRE